MKNTKLLVVAALCVALGVVLPVALHFIPNAGKILSPMHIPVLLCGILCGWQYGLMCGIVTPILSSLLTGMPPMPYLPSMVVELAIYGLVGGILFSIIKTKSEYLNVLLSLLGAMLVGRIVSGILAALIFSAGEYSFNMWLTSYFINALPGIIAHIVLVPILVMLLRKAGIMRKTEKAIAK